mmetsp:Transcript_17839/g.60843  ORF Transcript_17839/g.60843 Transcript_17839/m.60843 type:complete len:487 (-) Transcript_17839:1171-2631(-)
MNSAVTLSICQQILASKKSLQTEGAFANGVKHLAYGEHTLTSSVSSSNANPSSYKKSSLSPVVVTPNFIQQAEDLCSKFHAYLMWLTDFIQNPDSDPRVAMTIKHTTPSTLWPFIGLKNKFNTPIYWLNRPDVMIDHLGNVLCVEYNTGACGGILDESLYNATFTESLVLQKILQDLKATSFATSTVEQLKHSLGHTVASCMQNSPEAASHCLFIYEGSITNGQAFSDALQHNFENVTLLAREQLQSTCKFENGKLILNSKEVTFVCWPSLVKHLTDGNTESFKSVSLAEKRIIYGCEAILRAVELELIPIIPHPLHFVGFNKATLGLLWDPHFAKSMPPEFMELRKYVPETTVLSKAINEKGWHKALMNKDDFVLKPTFCSGGKGVLVGRHTPLTVWQNALDKARNASTVMDCKLLQRCVQQEQMPVIVLDTGGGELQQQHWHVTLGVLCVNEKFTGIDCRVCPDSVVNIAAGGSGSAVFVHSKQ